MVSVSFLAKEGYNPIVAISISASNDPEREFSDCVVTIKMLSVDGVSINQSGLIRTSHFQDFIKHLGSKKLGNSGLSDAYLTFGFGFSRTKKGEFINFVVKYPPETDKIYLEVKSSRLPIIEKSVGEYPKNPS